MPDCSLRGNRRHDRQGERAYGTLAGVGMKRERRLHAIPTEPEPQEKIAVQPLTRLKDQPAHVSLVFSQHREEAHSQVVGRLVDIDRKRKPYWIGKTAGARQAARSARRRARHWYQQRFRHPQTARSTAFPVCSAGRPPAETER